MKKNLYDYSNQLAYPIQSATTLATWKKLRGHKGILSQSISVMISDSLAFMVHRSIYLNIKGIIESQIQEDYD
jgi:hypothetical protein